MASSKARYTEQIVTLVEPDMRQRVEALSEEHNVSIAAVMRQVCAFGVPVIEGADDALVMKYLTP